MPHQNAAYLQSSEVAPDRPPASRREKRPPAHSSTFEKLETLEGLHRRHGATAKLTYGLVSMHMSGRPSIAVTSGVCRKLHRGAEATIVKVVIAVRAAARPRCQPPGQYYSFDQKCKSYVS